MALSGWRVKNYCTRIIQGSLWVLWFTGRESPERENNSPVHPRLQFDRIGCHRGLVKSSLSRLLRLGVTMSRRSSGGGNGIAGDEGQRYGPEVLFSRGGVSPPRLEHEEL